MCSITDISMSLISFKKYNNIDINKIKKDDNIQIGIEKSENRKVQLFWTKVDQVISKDEIIVNINDNNIVIKLENIYYYIDDCRSICPCPCLRKFPVWSFYSYGDSITK